MTVVMPRLLCPILLIASASLPSTALALGLGELHVESALGQGFVAHIDLIDASSADLARLTAAIADEDTFRRNQLERPGFLVGTAVTVGQDARGRPILLLRSKDSFTEPVVTFLVDVHWGTGELIREYTALLDPSELASRMQQAAPQALHTTATEAPALSAPVVRVTPVIATPTQPVAQVTRVSALPTQHAATGPGPKSQLRSYKVAHGDTLVRIAITAGARSGKERHRMMIAIYRANPAVFQKSFDILHTGDVLRVPSAEELAAISVADAEREYRAQLAASHATDRRKPRTHSSKHGPGDIEFKRDAAVVESKADAASLETDKLALRQRVESLEQSLQEVRQELQQRAQQTTTLPPPVSASTSAPDTHAVAATGSSDDGAPPLHRRGSFIALISGLGLMLAAGLWWAFGRRRDADPGTALQAAPDSMAALEPKPLVRTGNPSAEIPAREPAASRPSETLTSGKGLQTQAGTHDVNPPLTSVATAPVEAEEQVDAGDTTAVLAQAIEGFDDTEEHKFSFYNPDSHLDTTHVVMGSELTRPLAFVERRKNPTIVLQQAIEREPHRSDLHLKLLELYYASATENRLAFLEAARQIMHKQGLVSAEDWARIADMGRHIAPDDELFRNALDDQAVA
jgi:pilus assembly protein FimV